MLNLICLMEHMLKRQRKISTNEEVKNSGARKDYYIARYRIFLFGDRLGASVNFE